MPEKSAPSSAWASRRWRSAAMRKSAARAPSRPHSVRRSPAVRQPVSSMLSAGERRTLWGLLGARAALFRIAADRHRREAQALLGADFSGITCSDRWWAYDYLD